MLPIRITLAGCSTISVTGRSPELSSWPGLDGHAVGADHYDPALALRLGVCLVAHIPSLSECLKELHLRGGRAQILFGTLLAAAAQRRPEHLQPSPWICRFARSRRADPSVHPA